MIDDIIAAGPWRDENCEMSKPWRVVLRDLGHELVVHVQIKNPDGTCFFEHGDYFHKPADLQSFKKIDRLLEKRS